MTLLPPNATSLERLIEEAVSEVVPVPITALWNPNTCPVSLLPWLAWALSIDGWKDYWPESVKRARVRSSIDIQRRKGTARSVRDVVESFGGRVVIEEWWQQTPRGVPHTFTLTLALNGVVDDSRSAAFVDDVIDEVTRTKPARSHFIFTQALTAGAGVGVVAGAKAALYRRLEFTGE